MTKAKVGIINVTGYAGVELARLLYQHPEVELTSVTGRSAAGKKMGEVFPHLASIDLTIEADLGEVDLAFSAMPHKESARQVMPLLDHGVKVVDISADFRLKEADEYEQWYGFNHPAPQLLKQAVYGLTELYRPRVASAQLVSLQTHFAEANEDATAYALDGHRHLPEIIQELKLLSPKQPLSITFVPHLIPMTRGILTTGYAPLASGKVSVDQRGMEELFQLYRDFYKDEPFVKVVEFPPHTKHTWGNNLCLIHPTIDTRTGRLVVISAIDNLVKGAAGQAIQNMNLMLGIPEVTGLEALAVYP